MEHENNNTNQVKQILIDMVRYTPIKVYKIHGVGLQTQKKIKRYVASIFLKSTPKKQCESFRLKTK